MPYLTENDHKFCLKACADARATPEEKEFLGYMASLSAAQEEVSKDEARRVAQLTGSSLTVEGSIFDRPKIESKAKEPQSQSYTIWVYDHDVAHHHDNDLSADTVDNLEVAGAIARFRVQDTAHNTGWAKVVDNNIVGKMGDNGVLFGISKTTNGNTRLFDKRDGVEFENIQARPGKTFIGQIAKMVGADFAIQDAGRGSLVVHQLSKLDAALAVGDKASIKYNAEGRGKVEPLVKAKDNSLSR